MFPSKADLHFVTESGRQSVSPLTETRWTSHSYQDVADKPSVHALVRPVAVATTATGGPSKRTSDFPEGGAVGWDGFQRDVDILKRSVRI